MNRAARRLLPSLLRRTPHPPSLYPTARPLCTAAAIPSILSSASASKPLKDAIKFTAAPLQNPTVWTYRELHTHVSALSAGLSELSLPAPPVIMTLLSPHTPEYIVTLLAAANLSAKLVALAPPSDPASVSVHSLSAALHKYQPSVLFVGAEFRPAHAAPEEDGIVASVNPLVNALAPDVALRDAAGLNGFVPLTGRPFHSPDHPYLRHVVHTGDANVRGLITFRSLLVYNGAAPKQSGGKLPLLVDAQTGQEWGADQILKDANAIGEEMSLSKDHTAKNGKIVLTPAVSERNAAAIVSAVMHETLCVSPASGDAKAVSQAENALVV